MLSFSHIFASPSTLSLLTRNSIDRRFRVPWRTRCHVTRCVAITAFGVAKTRSYSQYSDGCHKHALCDTFFGRPILYSAHKVAFEVKENMTKRFMTKRDVIHADHPRPILPLCIR